MVKKITNCEICGAETDITIRERNICLSCLDDIYTGGDDALSCIMGLLIKIDSLINDISILELDLSISDGRCDRLEKESKGD